MRLLPEANHSQSTQRGIVAAITKVRAGFVCIFSHAPGRLADELIDVSVDNLLIF